MSSLQSFLDSAECGTTNPMLDLARQFTSTATPGTNNSSVADAILSLDEMNSLNNVQNQSIGSEDVAQNRNEFSCVESLLNDQGSKNDTFQSAFNMESLLKEMNRLGNSNFGNTDSSTIFSDNPLKTDLDPLISNHPASIEKNFWNEAIGNNNETFSTLDKDFLDFQSTNNNNLPELNVDWADEYLQGLELNNKINPINESDEKSSVLSENVWKLNDKEQKSHRNQTVDNVDLLFHSSYLPFTRQFDQHENPSTEINDANLNDLVSDQENRLINMLLGNNSCNDVRSNSPFQTNTNKEESEKVTDISRQQTTTIKDNVQSVSKESGESFFYENQFDDMEFWMKLAEEWHSNENDPSKVLGNSKETHIGEDGKMIQLKEPLNDLMDEKHPYYYRCIENNPFIISPKSERDEAKDDIKIDYIEEGIKRMNIGDLSAAVLLFEAAVQEKPDSSNAWLLLGVATAKNENDHKSISAMKRCLALTDSTIQQQLDALMHLATSFTNESMNTEACYALQEWLRQHPKYKDLVRDQNDPLEKNETYLGPEPLSQRWTNQKNIFVDGFFDSVKQSFIDAVLKSSTDQPDPDVQSGLGVLHNISGEYGKAIDCFRTALSVRPDDYQLWNRYGASLANNGRAEESMFAFREALARYPGYIRARYNLAISCIMLGVGEQATEHLLAILNLQTSGADTIKDLVSLNLENITSCSVWNLMRSALSIKGREDLLKAVDERNLELLNHEIKFSQPEEQEKPKTPI